jgi:hypothetical protein
MRTCSKSKDKTRNSGFLARALAGLMITTTIAVGSLTHAVLNIQGVL